MGGGVEGLCADGAAGIIGVGDGATTVAQAEARKPSMSVAAIDEVVLRMGLLMAPGPGAS